MISYSPLNFSETPKLTPRDHYMRTSRYLPGQVTRINTNNNNANDFFGRQPSNLQPKPSKLHLYKISASNSIRE